MLNKRIKEYFNFTKRERNGVIVLLFILLSLILVNVYLKKQTFGYVSVVDEQFQKEVELFEKLLVPKAKQPSKDIVLKQNNENKWMVPDSLFYFNPNNVKKNELKKLGFADKQIDVFINYREKGGRFKQKKDMLKVYGISQKQYQALEPFIIIEDDIKENKTVILKPKILRIEINSATVKDLVELPGIGESYANKIIKYRELLGGYCQKDQLLEVYGMDTSKLFRIDSLINIDTSLIKKMNINSVKYNTLIRHPYLNKYQTNSIMKYRELSGKFTKIEQLIEFNVLSKEDLLKLKPYIFIKLEE